MSKQAIEEIKAAEAKAKKIREDARTRARFMLDETNKSCTASYAKAEQQMEKSMRERLADLSKKTDDLIAKSIDDSKNEAAAMYAKSADRVKSCSRLITGRVLAKWQL
ncbi:MAG: hypothetical protein IJT60_07080 [Clostridia bacterium]|nr:hypothetical protein [Clostridia bacterium]